MRRQKSAQELEVRITSSRDPIQAHAPPDRPDRRQSCSNHQLYSPSLAVAAPALVPLASPTADSPALRSFPTGRPRETSNHPPLRQELPGGEAADCARGSTRHTCAGRNARAAPR